MKQNHKPIVLVIFGITGNLAQIKLIPALYDLAKAGLLPKNLTVLGIGRKKMTNTEFRSFTKNILHKKNPHEHPIAAEFEEQLLKTSIILRGTLIIKNCIKKLSTI